MEEQIRQLEDRIKTLEDSLGAAATLPYNNEQAIRERLRLTELDINKVISLKISSKNVNSEDITVNEAGSSSYAVMDDADIFLELELKNGNGVITTYYVPAFTS
jgi:hypothetical protein